MVPPIIMFSQVFFISCLLHLSWTAPPGQEQNEKIYDCDSNIFCYGSILEAVQLSNVLPSSKSFVDMKTKHLPSEVVKNFEALKQRVKNLIGNRQEMDRFVKENFVEDKLEKTELLGSRTEYDVTSIVDEGYRNFYGKLVSKWDNLAVRTPTTPVPDGWGTMISLPHYFIKTGESKSFPEIWQNLLIVRGLLASGLHDSARGIILNEVELLETGDFVPLTNRIYATKRTQLPLLAFMVEDYMKAIRQANVPENMEFIHQVLPAVTKDFLWWIKNAGVEIEKGGKTYTLYQYKQQATEPRPEKYKSDYNQSVKLAPNEKSAFFAAVRSIDETAFGNSSRFQSTVTTSSGTSKNIIIKDLVTVELNSVLQKCAMLLEMWHRLVKGANEETDNLHTIATNIQTGIDNVLWNNTRGIWLDWNLEEKKHTDKYYVTNLMGLLSSNNDVNKVNQVIMYLKNIDIINPYDSSFKLSILPTSKNSPSGVLPTSINSPSGELGDHPYGSVFWNVLAIDGLRKSQNKEAQKVAKNIASDLIKTMFDQHIPHEALFEYYREDQDIEPHEVQIVKGGSSAAIGAFITLLDWYKNAHYELSSGTDSD